CPVHVRGEAQIVEGAQWHRCALAGNRAVTAATAIDEELLDLTRVARDRLFVAGTARAFGIVGHHRGRSRARTQHRAHQERHGEWDRGATMGRARLHVRGWRGHAAHSPAWGSRRVRQVSLVMRALIIEMKEPPSASYA